ncbi:MAG: DUF6276 family protein [Halolamina sp.]|uniref:DUF6276 family protein n=1 Tax=Halolamina sp. TaxID=1940283 RepID=UPI002FC39EB8
MPCPDCGAPVVAFTVPESLREYAPADDAVLCTRCLRTAPWTDDQPQPVSPDDAEFSAVDETFPSGRAGVAFALALGKLGSLALERSAIEALCETAEREGSDVWLALDRLSRAENLEPHFDIARRTEQLSSFR